jgi:hypothetical protein
LDILGHHWISGSPFVAISFVADFARKMAIAGVKKFTRSQLEHLLSPQLLPLSLVEISP